eukprot:scaffold112991_cov39-Prasinocladus_malaysianus.AAC.1
MGRCSASGAAIRPESCSPGSCPGLSHRRSLTRGKGLCWATLVLSIPETARIWAADGLPAAAWECQLLSPGSKVLSAGPLLLL